MSVNSSPGVKVPPHDLPSNEVTLSLLACAAWPMMTWQVSVAELTKLSSSFTSVVNEDADLNAFGGWFDTDFRGSAADPAAQPVTLTTSPESNTHWAQQVFMVHPPIPVQVGDTLEGTVKLARQRLNHRLMWVQLTLTLNRPGIGQVGPERTLNFRID